MITLGKRKIKPTVYFPLELEKDKYVGKIYGLYIENSNHYNIVTTESDSNYSNLIELGEVVENKPANAPSKGLVGYFENDCIQFIDCEDVVCKKEPYSLKLDIFSRNVGILESDMMLKTGAMLVGCGSVGSLVALELAKAGVGRFLLIDNDILGYHNICRHQCGILDVGKYKTDAVKERILQINPSAHVVTQNMTVQEVPLNVFDEFCDENTIVIGGADNREGDLYANKIAKEVGMPLMSIGCWKRA